MKRLVAELDNICRNIESFGEPWAYNIIWKIEKVAQELEEISSNSKLSSISKSVLNQYMEKMTFLTKNGSKLKEIIKKHNSKNAFDIYEKTKEHFGKLNRDDAIEFIKNNLKDLIK